MNEIIAVDSDNVRKYDDQFERSDRVRDLDTPSAEISLPEQRNRAAREAHRVLVSHLPVSTSFTLKIPEEDVLCNDVEKEPGHSHLLACLRRVCRPEDGRGQCGFECYAREGLFKVTPRLTKQRIQVFTVPIGMPSLPAF